MYIEVRIYDISYDEAICTSRVVCTCTVYRSLHCPNVLKTTSMNMQLNALLNPEILNKSYLFSCNLSDNTSEAF